MTASTYSNMVRSGVVEAVSVYMVNIELPNLSAHTTSTIDDRSVDMFKNGKSVFELRRIFTDSVTGITGFRTVLSTSAFYLGFLRRKRGLTVSTLSVVRRLLVFFATPFRTIRYVGVLCSRFKVLKNLTAVKTLFFQSRLPNSYVSTGLRTKALFLVINSTLLCIKRRRTNTANKRNTTFFESILTHSRTESVLLSFKLIWKDLENFTAMITRNVHGWNVTA